MEKRVLFLFVVGLVLVIVAAKPISGVDNYDDELLATKDTVHYPYLFWFGRPFYERDDDGDNTYRNYEQRSSTLSYTHVGAGWGR
ncbi:uncharacterized protein LOC143426410 [Xylocopa sonorina]|uniref:uncharacterized protein LOC143426410 n=1 Tax=Xylocopa sonorina TaxID=1818115 RepID=UPI00403AD69D